MSVYRPIADVAISHAFFRSGRLEGMRAAPTAATARKLTNLNFVFRATSEGFTLLIDDSRVEALDAAVGDSADSTELEFAVSSRDPAFGFYTAGFEDCVDRVFYFSNGDVRKPQDGLRPMHDGDYAGPSDKLDRDDERFRRAAETSGLGSNPDMLICLALETIVADADSQMARYSISFDARRTKWKYLLVGAAADESYEVHGPDDRVRFTFKGPERLGDSTEVLTFMSENPIPLTDRYSNAPQLRVGQGSNKRVLIRHLPVPSIDCISNASVGDDATLISELYVNY